MLTSPPPAAADELQRHLDAVAVGIVEDQLAVALQRVGRRHPAHPARPGRGSASHTRSRSSAAIVTGRSTSRPNRASLRPYLSRALRILLVVNSFASSVTARNTVVVHRRLARDNDVEVVETNRRGHATRFAPDAARRGFDVVIGYGGDGTLNEVATGIAGTDAALGVLPGGSTNVFARTLGMPNDPIAAVDLLANGIDGRRHPPDRTRTRQRAVLLLPHRDRVRRRRRPPVERHASIKRWLGHPLFISAALTTWASGYDRHHPHFSLDGRRRAPPRRRVLLDRPQHQPVHVPRQPPARPLTRRHPRSRAGRRHVPHAAGRGRSSKGSSGALRGGGVRPTEHLVEWTDLEELVAWHDEPFPYQVDGDYLGETSRLEFAHVPDAVRLVFPAELERRRFRGRRARRGRCRARSCRCRRRPTR